VESEFSLCHCLWGAGGVLGGCKKCRRLSASNRKRRQKKDGDRRKKKSETEDEGVKRERGRHRSKGLTQERERERQRRGSCFSSFCVYLACKQITRFLHISFNVLQNLRASSMHEARKKKSSVQRSVWRQIAYMVRTDSPFSPFSPFWKKQQDRYIPSDD